MQKVIIQFLFLLALPYFDGAVETLGNGKFHQRVQSYALDVMYMCVKHFSLFP